MVYKIKLFSDIVFWLQIWHYLDVIKRVICDIVLFLGIFFLPWWGTVILVFVFMILFKRFWEGIIAMLFIDSLYSLPTSKVYGHFGIFTVSAVVFLFLIKYAKKQIRFNL